MPGQAKAITKRAEMDEHSATLREMEISRHDYGRLIRNAAEWINGITSKKKNPPEYKLVLEMFALNPLLLQEWKKRSLPNIFRVCCVVCYIITLIHWNASLYYIISYWVGFGADSWAYGKANKQSLPDGVEDTLARRYIYSIYWSTLILTTLGGVPWPVLSVEMIFVALDCMCGVLIIATIVGNVGSMIGAMGEARTLFQGTVDATRTRPKWGVHDRWTCGSLPGSQYPQVVRLPVGARSTVRGQPRPTPSGNHVHFETLRKVRIFQDCEAGLLSELLLKKLKLQGSPRTCTNGGYRSRNVHCEAGGRLQVVGFRWSPKTASGGRRRRQRKESSGSHAPRKRRLRRAQSACIRCVGYYDLFSLNKDDLWEALGGYPDAKKMLIQKGRQILDKDGLLDETAPVDTKSPEETIVELREASLSSKHDWLDSTPNI